MLCVVKSGLIPAHAGKTCVVFLFRFGYGAHPRACGENDSLRALISSRKGSSPRMRGKPRVLLLSPLKAGLIPAHAGKTLLGVVFTRARGLIPAHAGKTTGAQPETASPEAHPRACGENVDIQNNGAYRGGSSPRMRGKPSAPMRSASRSGLIPAHAGKTPWQKRCQRSCAAHPRACGENNLHLFDLCQLQGSSPRMRGKLANCLGHNVLLRLIPAHAGKT